MSRKVRTKKSSLNDDKRRSSHSKSIAKLCASDQWMVDHGIGDPVVIPQSVFDCPPLTLAQRRDATRKPVPCTVELGRALKRWPVMSVFFDGDWTSAGVHRAFSRMFAASGLRSESCTFSVTWKGKNQMELLHPFPTCFMDNKIPWPYPEFMLYARKMISLNTGASAASSAVKVQKKSKGNTLDEYFHPLPRSSIYNPPMSKNRKYIPEIDNERIDRTVAEVH